MAVQRNGNGNGKAKPLLDQVDLKIIFTGLCSYAITPGNGVQAKATFVMPNTRTWRNSLNDGSVRIPPHRAFLIARRADVAFEHGSWKGHPPAGMIQEKWVYWTFDSDLIYIDQLPRTGVEVGNVRDVVDLPTLCRDAEMSDECLSEQCDQVAARVVFESGRIAQRSLTTSLYKLETCRGEKLGPKEIADEVQVSISRVPRNGRGEIVFKRCALDGTRDGRPPIILKPVDPLTKIFFGSAPEVDLAAVVSRAPNHRHDTTNAHFELHYEISKRRPYAPVPVPERDESNLGANVSRIGPIAGTDRCPPSSSKGTT